MKFHLRHVIAVTHGIYLPREGEDVDLIYNILNFLTDDNLFTHQLPRASRDCKPDVLRQLPFFESVPPVPDEDAYADRDQYVTDLEAWADQIAEKHGEWHNLEPCPTNTSPHQNPIMELGEMVGDKEIMVVEVPEDES